MLSPSSGAISELSLLDHYCRDDTQTPSYRCYPICVKSGLINQYKKIRVLSNFWLSAISELRKYLLTILVRSLLQRWYSNAWLSLLRYFVRFVFWQFHEEVVCSCYYIIAEVPFLSIKESSKNMKKVWKKPFTKENNEMEENTGLLFFTKFYLRAGLCCRAICYLRAFALRCTVIGSGWGVMFWGWLVPFGGSIFSVPWDLVFQGFWLWDLRGWHPACLGL